MLLQLEGMIGRVLNFLGFASPIVECDYEASICDARVAVRQRPLFTIVTVNGLDVYFHRLTGEIDGVGFSPTSDCKLASTHESIGSDAEPACLPEQVHSRNRQASAY